MTTKAILGVSLAAIFVVTMMIAPISGTSHFSPPAVVSSSSFDNGKTGIIVTASDIPDADGTEKFGYAYVLSVDSGIATALGITTHIGADDSSAQVNAQDPELHVHLLTAELGSADCPSNGGGNKVLTASVNEFGKTDVSDNLLRVSNINPQIDIDSAAAVIGFGIWFETNVDGDITAVCFA